ncbi:MAG: DNA repair protein RecN, partial [Dysgonamonadaceae bacterium]|nr:DNA repair protein RecN [Dysgonamonadaceae bacterium]
QQKTEEDYLRFQFNQLKEAKLQQEEQAGLEQEAETLAHLEDIKTGLYQIEQLLSMEETGIVPALKNAQQTVLSLHKIFTPAEEISERIQTAYLDLKDLAAGIQSRQENLEFNPERLQQVTERLDLIYSLQLKHKMDSVGQLLELQKNLEQKLQAIDYSDEAILQLENELNQHYTQVKSLSEALTETRRQSARLLEQQLVEKISVLGMSNMRFITELTQKEQPDATGSDEVVYFFSANKNVELKPVAQTASGGEISRLMLGIKALISGTMALPTIIFDEIDTGVSGEIADRMGNIMHRMGEVMQVIAITHLPQIAAKGEAQFFVYKEETNQATETHIRRLAPDERVREIAQMLSGAELTEAAIANAKQLLKQ